MDDKKKDMLKELLFKGIKAIAVLIAVSFIMRWLNG